MYLASSSKVNTRKSSIHDVIERWHADLSQVDINLFAAVNTRNRPSVNYGKVQL